MWKKERENLNNNCIQSKIRYSWIHFLPGHPQHNSHVVKSDPLKKDVVPNFMGGSLPCSDQGDRDFYCCTMLTLFKPCRTGRDLKNINETWDNAFVQYSFTDQQN